MTNLLVQLLMRLLAVLTALERWLAGKASGNGNAHLSDELTALRGAMRQVAADELDEGEVDGNNRGASIRKYFQAVDPSLYPAPWCAAFVSWCIAQAYARVYRSRPPFQLSTSAKKLFRAACRAGARVETPEVGDLVCWHRGDPSSWKGHIGIVVAVTNRGSIYWVDGNGSGPRGEVQTRHARISDMPHLLGFARLPARSA